jgi:hypothetical protein
MRYTVTVSVQEEDKLAAIWKRSSESGSRHTRLQQN